MSHYGLCEACAAAGATGLRRVEPNRRERLWITHDYRRLCDYHFEEYLDS